MAKEKTVYVCSNCGQESPKWVGKCPSCGEWNTYVEEVIRKEVVNKRPVSGIETEKPKPIVLSEIEADDEPRIDLHDEVENRESVNLLWYYKLCFTSLKSAFFMYRVRKVPVS